MTTIEDIKRAITHLSQDDGISFNTWYEEFKAKFWNKSVRKEEVTDNKLDKLIESKTVSISGETTLYGIVKAVGGVPSTAWIQTLEGKHILCQVDQKLAIKLGSLLYTRIGMSGIAKWDVTDSSIQAFQIKKITAYKETPLSEAFSLLSFEMGHYYNNIDALKWVSTIRKNENSIQIP